MCQLVYAMRFNGRATPAGPDGGVLTVRATATSVVLTTIIGPHGLDGRIETVPSGEATLASELTFTGETSFQEVGTIGFGEGHRLHFSTIGGGYLKASADPARKHGSVMWHVDGGEGQFAGASGLITSNFFVESDLTVTDHHFGVILLA